MTLTQKLLPQVIKTATEDLVNGVSVCLKERL